MSASVTSFISGNTNCYVLKSEHATVLIDCGVASDKNFIKKLSQHTDPCDIDMLVLTHGHYDHVGNAWFLQQKYGVKVAIHKLDAFKVMNASMDFPDTNSLIGSIVKTSSSINLKSKRYHAFCPDIILEGQYTEFSCPELSIVHLPGHTMGSIGVLWYRNLFAGDLFMNIGGLSESLFAEDFDALYKSISNVKKIRGIEQCFLGHGKCCDFQLVKGINKHFTAITAS